LVGCNNRTKPEGDQTPRVCPRCHNAAVIRVKSRMWFELFFIPLIPMKSEHLWVCTICHWDVPLQQAWEPPLPYGGQDPWQGPPYVPMSPPPNAATYGYQPQYPPHPSSSTKPH
ncbi:hypothetical protein LXA43DRAFT_880933, partial [Ganoderma leucocontextum]